ncbi:hypothetical protein PRIEUP_LOCUS253, partial [Pristimantis euphronides]
MGSTMWLLCLLLSMELVQSNKIPSYGLFIPPDLYYGSENMFCLHCSREMEGFSKISVDLKTSSGSEILYTVLPDSPIWHCQSFQVPEPSGTTEKVTIAVHGHRSEGDKIEFSSKELTMRKINSGTLIQTDKAMYKRGQTVKYRMVTVDQNLEVMNKTVSVI